MHGYSEGSGRVCTLTQICTDTVMVAAELPVDWLTEGCDTLIWTHPGLVVGMGISSNTSLAMATPLVTVRVRPLSLHHVACLCRALPRQVWCVYVRKEPLKEGYLYSVQYCIPTTRYNNDTLCIRAVTDLKTFGIVYACTYQLSRSNIVKRGGARTLPTSRAGGD